MQGPLTILGSILLCLWDISQTRCRFGAICHCLWCRFLMSTSTGMSVIKVCNLAVPRTWVVVQMVWVVIHMLCSLSSCVVQPKRESLVMEPKSLQATTRTSISQTCFCSLARKAHSGPNSRF
jgi:hypothetical protein